MLVLFFENTGLPTKDETSETTELTLSFFKLMIPCKCKFFSYLLKKIIFIDFLILPWKRHN